MADILGGEEFPLPQVAKSLSPYIKTRQEALRIRRVLSIYIESNIEGLPIGSLSITSLAVPGEELQVRKIPSEISGLRRSYLKALQAHAKAKNEYAQLTRSSLYDTKAVRQKERQDEEDSRESVDIYLALTKEQRKFEKITILHDYLDLLSQKEAARPDYLRMSSVLKGVAFPPETIQTPAFHTLPPPTSKTDIQALTTRLERTVLSAKSSLDKQRALLAKTKKELESRQIPGQTITVGIGTKIDALSHTRDELIGWIEEHLAKSSQSNDATERLPISDSEGAPLNISKRKKDIQHKYEDYVEARQSLVALLSSRPALSIQNTSLKAEKPEMEPRHKVVDNSWPKASSVLPYLTEYLIPTTNAQRSFLQQESHISSTLASENHVTVQVLNRLAEESHLLPNYPILAMQPRFQNVVAALRSKSSPSSSNETTGRKDESQTLSQARQWAFAADAATSAKHEAVKERLGHGKGHLNTAGALAKELREILDVDEEENEDNENEGEEDIWTEDVVTKPQKQTSSSGHAGLWAGLDGRLGIVTEKSKRES